MNRCCMRAGMGSMFNVNSLSRPRRCSNTGALLDDRHVRLDASLAIWVVSTRPSPNSILEREAVVGNPARLRTLAKALNKLADEALALRPQDPRTQRRL